MRATESRSEPINLRSPTRHAKAADADDARGWLLSCGVKSLLRCDEAEVVEGIARYVMSQHGSLRVGAALMERAGGTPLPSAAALLGGLTRFLEVRCGERNDGAVWIARLSNERRAVESFPASLPELGWSEWKFRRRPSGEALAASLKGAAAARRVFHIARMLHRRHEFFKVLRVVELFGYYARFLGLFRGGRYRLALTSNHSNPHGIAFNLAARRCGVPVVLVTHGMPVRPVARLAYDLAVVHCEAARRAYLEAGCRIGRVLIHGRRQDYAPMPAGPLPGRLSVGVFLCKDVNEGRVRALVERLLAHPRVERVLVRPHPKNLWRCLDSWIESRDEPRLRRSRAGPVSQDLKAADIVLAGNSSVLVEAVTAGRPAGYVAGIDHGPDDLHAFVARGLIYPFEDELDFDPERVLRFYQPPEWASVLRLFANVDEDESAVAARACEVMRALAAGDGFRAVSAKSSSRTSTSL